MRKLIYNQGHFDERVFDLTGPSVEIGRSNECGICVLHKSLSRRHAQIDLSGSVAALVDLGSKNGSFVNGVRVTRQDLAPGDTVKLGDLQFSFVEGAETASQRGSGSPLGDTAAPEPTLVMGLSRLSIEHLLRDAGAGSALKVKPVEAGKRAQDKLQILLKVSQVLSSPDEIDSLLHKILDLVFQILDVERAVVLLIDPATGRLEPKVHKSVLGARDRQPFYSRHIVEYVRSKSLAAIFSDAAGDARFAAAQSIVYQSIRSSMCVPLAPKDEVIGVLYVDNVSVPHRFSEEDLEFLAAFANQAAIAIENAMLYRRVEEEAIHRMQLVMQEKLASMSALVAGIAHELKNPLHFVNNFAEVSVELLGDVDASVRAQQDRLDPEAFADLEDVLGELRTSAGKIVEHGKRASGIIDGMLLHARDSHGVREQADLNAVVGESVSLAHRAAATKSPEVTIAIDAKYDAAVDRVEMVRDDLRRVFINVVDNACYAMREKRRALGAGYAPVLTIRTHARGDRVEVRIRDNGTGVPADVADKIYNPFFSTKPPGEGTGLGLSISYDIVVQGHQGEMRMDTASGEHTEFVITLPRRSGQTSPRSRSSIGRITSPTTAPGSGKGS